jgi:ubiquinone/menaquinone biosynthesis C-methylase UbiE
MPLKRLSDIVNATYGSARLADRLLASLQAVGYDPDRLSPADLITFDELHVMGRQATLDLGRLAGLTGAMRLLDIGCGLGGSARTLAAEFGCHVTGVDLSLEFVTAARVLSRRVGLSERVDFLYADAQSLPFDGEKFDAAVMIHVTMNIADKKSLFAEARRVVTPGGKLALWEIVKTAGPGIIYPVPWADDAAFSFLLSKSEMVALVGAAGFRPLQSDDATDEAAGWIRARLAPKPNRRPKLPRPDLDLVLDNFRLKRANLSKSLLEGAVGVLRMVAIRED